MYSYIELLEWVGVIWII